jgi:RNA polymerase sigma factor (sigma-70 family)
LEKEAFRELFDRYFDDIRKYLFYRSGNEALATDLAQDTFLRIWEKQVDVDPLRIKGLLLKIASDLFVSSYRKQQSSFSFFNHFQVNEKSLTPEDELNYQELKNAYEKALANMPEKQRTVFLMNRVDELKYHEIADQLGLSVKAVEKRMGLALVHLRKFIKTGSNGIILFFLELHRLMKQK